MHDEAMQIDKLASPNIVEYISIYTQPHEGETRAILFLGVSSGRSSVIRSFDY